MAIVNTSDIGEKHRSSFIIFVVVFSQLFRRPGTAGNPSEHIGASNLQVDVPANPEISGSDGSLYPVIQGSVSRIPSFVLIHLVPVS